MNFQHESINVNAHLASRTQPTFLFGRPLIGGREQPKGGLFLNAEVAREGVFWVPTSSLLDHTVTWMKTTQGPFVRVPLFAYRVNGDAPSLVFAFGIELGARAVTSLMLDKGLPQIKEVLLVTGDQVHRVDQPQPGCRVYFGLSIRTE